jgi:hypothetical protein
VVEFQVRLEISADGDWSAGEFVFHAYDTVYAEGKLAIAIIMPMEIGAIIGADMCAGTYVPPESRDIAADVAVELIETRDAETIVPEGG